MTHAAEINVGALVAFSTGEYSDYNVIAFGRVLKPINETAWEEMREACTAPPSYDPKGEPQFNEEKAVPWLIAQEYIEELSFSELHLGDYNMLPKWSEA